MNETPTSAATRERQKLFAVSTNKWNLRILSCVTFLCILCAFFIAMRQMGSYSLQNRLSLFAETTRLRLAMSVNSELALALKMADSPLIQRYFLDPDNHALKDAALEELFVYRRHFKNNSIFWINDIDKIFHSDDGNNSYLVNPSIPGNYWYDLTLYRTPKYNFNINYNPDIQQINLWVNAPVFTKMPDGSKKAVGMLGTGINLDDFTKFIYQRQDTDTTLYMFNSANEITFAENYQLVFDKVPIQSVLGDVTAQIFDIARNLAREELHVFVHNDVIYAVSSVAQMDWILVTSIPLTFSAIFNSIMNGIVAGSLVIILLLIVVFNIFAARARDEMEKQNLELTILNSKANAASKTKNDFLARTSHEIRTPMNAILGMSELAQREYGTPKALEYIVGIRNAGTNLLAIINDILDFSKIESGNMQINPEPYETASLLNDALAVIRVRLAEKPIELVTDIAASIPATLVGDAPRVRQVLLNLLSNAVKYTEKGFVKFTAAGERVSDTKIRLTFTVEDSGVGIQGKDMPSLFGDFVRLEENRRQNIEGTGLGLTIARSLCRAMGGEVTATSDYGRGSVFTAALLQGVTNWMPVGNVTAQKAYRLEKWRTVFTAPEAKVLVVDDLPSNLLVAEGLLDPYGMRIFTCLSGQEAVNMVQERHFDLVLMDHMMPGMDGLEATAAIRALEGTQNRRMPIVALTANAVSGMKEMFLENGFDDFLSKPIELPKLDAILEKWIPAEKLRKASAGEKVDATTALPAIDGLDMAVGVATVGGSRAQYRALLEIFCRDARARLPHLAGGGRT